MGRLTRGDLHHILKGPLPPCSLSRLALALAKLAIRLMKEQRGPRSEVHVAVDYHRAAERARMSAGKVSRQNLCDQRELTKRKIM
eukprot:9336803-Pyramimonas_sp.AAC.1